MAQQVFKLYQNNSQFLEITGLQDQGTNPATVINDATLTGTLKDASGNAQAGATNIAGVYVPASNGNYTFAINGTGFNPPVDYTYVFVIDGTYSSGTKRYHAEIPSYVLVRSQGTET